MVKPGQTSNVDGAFTHGKHPRKLVYLMVKTLDFLVFSARGVAGSAATYPRLGTWLAQRYAAGLWD